MQEEKGEVTVVSQKGQVVIPQAIRKKLGIKPKTKLVVYGYQNVVIMQKIEIPDMHEKLRGIYEFANKKVAKFGVLSDEEINEIIQDHRKTRHSRANPECE